MTPELTELLGEERDLETKAAAARDAFAGLAATAREKRGAERARYDEVLLAARAVGIGSSSRDGTAQAVASPWASVG